MTGARRLLLSELGVMDSGEYSPWNARTLPIPTSAHPMASIGTPRRFRPCTPFERPRSGPHAEANHGRMRRGAIAPGRWIGVQLHLRL